MNDLEKLRHLLGHWIEHNAEHAEIYRNWAGKMASLGKGEIAAVLERLCEETRRLDGLFEEAKKKIG